MNNDNNEGIAVGIDLGTTNSVIAYQGKECKALHIGGSEDLLPSVVTILKGEIAVGRTVINYAEKQPKDTIFSNKRLMGHAFSDTEVQEIINGKAWNIAYEIVSPTNGTDKDLRVIMGGKEYSPVEISSFILKELKIQAEKILNREVKQAVITVPANFNEKQKYATREAAYKAGLQVLRILEEPSAAAIAYGVDNIDAEQTKNILVFDMGGGTFDVTVLTMSGGIFLIHDIEGDMWLGGDDIDNLIMKYLLNQINEEHGINIDRNSDDGTTVLFKLKRLAEAAKKDLSSVKSIDITALIQYDGQMIDIDVPLSRIELEKLIKPNVEKSILLTKKAIQKADLSQEDIDEVLLVGGTTLIPAFQDALLELFDRDRVIRNIDPMKCVAFGAARLAARLGDLIECPHCGELTPSEIDNCKHCNGKIDIREISGVEESPPGITSRSIGLALDDGRFSPIIPKGSPFPMEEPFFRTYYIPEENLMRVAFTMCEGEDKIANNNKQSGIVRFKLPPNVPKNTPVEVGLEIDSDGILKIHADLRGGYTEELHCHLDRGDDKRAKIEEELDKCVVNIQQKENDGDDVSEERDVEAKVIDLLNEGEADKAEIMLNKINELLVGKQEKPEWITSAENAIFWAEASLKRFPKLIDPELSVKMGSAIEKIKTVIEEGDEEACEKVSAELWELINQMHGLIHMIWHAQTMAYNLESISPKASAEIKTLVTEIEKGIKNDDVELVNGKVETLEVLLNEHKDDAPEDDIRRPIERRLMDRISSEGM